MYSYLIKHDDIFVTPEKDVLKYNHWYRHEIILPEILNVIYIEICIIDKYFVFFNSKIN